MHVPSWCAPSKGWLGRWCLVGPSDTELCAVSLPQPDEPLFTNLTDNFIKKDMLKVSDRKHPAEDPTGASEIAYHMCLMSHDS